MVMTDYTLSLEVYATDIVPGQTTYRFYQNMANTDDFMSSVYGNNEVPFSLSTTTGFYNSQFGSTVASGVNPAFLAFFPDLAADSWVTVGIESQNVGSEVAISVVESSDQPWVGAFAFGEAISGQDIVMNDNTGGAWYVLNGTPNGLPDADGRVLFMQLTTAGEISGVINTQVFGSGNGAIDIRNTYTVSGVGTYSPDGGDATNACGCTDPLAFNFDETAEYDDDSCIAVATGCIDDTACNFTEAANTDDGSCTYAADGYDCDGNCLSDTDGDGICDEFEVGGCDDASACNYDAGATDNDGSCTYAADGYDCDGNCLSDTDGDGICDEFEVGGCDDASACNYDAGATDNDGSCTYAADGYDCDGNCLSDTDGDGICDEFEVGGCTDPAAANYDPFATDDDASCLDPICIDPDACNYTEWNGNDYCLIVQPYQVHDSGDLDGFVTYRIYIKTQNADDFISSVSGDSEFPTRIMSSGSFFQSSFGGLLGSDQNPALFGFFPTAAYDSYVTIGLTETAAAGEGNINVIESAGNPWGNNFENGQDLLIDDAIGGGWFIFNGNTNGIAGDDEQVLLAQVTTDGALSGSLYVQVFVNGDVANDDRILLDIEEACAAPGGPEACDFPEDGYDCDGNCLSDTDGDGICDEFEVGGCDDATACNYDAGATDNDGSCTYAADGYDCDGNCLSDTDGDGVCDEFEVGGCDDAAACNYDAGATDNDGSCTYAADGYDCDGNCLSDTDGDGVCDEFEVGGCDDAAACNYDAGATDNDGSCTYAADGYDCDGNCLADADGDGVCDEFEVGGCDDAAACNYDAGATDNDGSCTYAADGYDCDGNCLSDTDGDGVCDEFEVGGCDDAAACNYDAGATDNDGSCTYAADGYDCDGNCLSDTDGDGICDEFEVGGCDDAAACNYDAGATDNDGSCTYAADGYDCDGNCLSDTDGDGICDEFEVGGCTDPAAANYDPLATDDDASCLDPICIDPDACNYTEWNGNDYCLIVQPYQVHDSGELDGFVTYRIYIKTQNADDFISSVSGDSDFPTRIMSSGSFFQSSFGGLLGSDQNPALFGFFPTAAYDSYVTIGLTESAAAGEGNINVIESVGNPWGNNFENGQDLLIDDAIGGGWFIFNGNTNGIAGDDEQVLLAQVTTDGALSGSLYVQVFVNGDVANDDRILLDIEEACAAPGGPEACDFPEDGYDCDGNCLSDTDGDGVCDEFEVGGCDDAAACNYDAGATDNDGSCSLRCRRIRLRRKLPQRYRRRWRMRRV